MAFWVFPLLMFTFMVGVIAVERVHVDSMVPTTEVMSERVAATHFIFYKSAVEDYARNNPSFTGQVPSSLLKTAPGEYIPASFQNLVISTATGRDVITWGDVSISALIWSLDQFGGYGDYTIGVVYDQNGNWKNSAGEPMGIIPGGVKPPVNYLVGVVQLTP